MTKTILTTLIAGTVLSLGTLARGEAPRSRESKSATLHDLQEQETGLAAQLKSVQDRLKTLEQEATLAVPSPVPSPSIKYYGNRATVTPPPPYQPQTPPASYVYTDITCRPKLSLDYPPSTHAERYDPTYEPSPTKAYLDDLPSIGNTQYHLWGEKPEYKYCNSLSPMTRLLLENLAFAVNDSYTNTAGSNLGSSVPVTQTAGNTYQVGIGYWQKPIAKQIRALVCTNPKNPAAALFCDDPKNPAAVRNQGKLSEDFFFNALQLNAGISYGKTLTLKNGGGSASSVVETLNSRPAYVVGLTYTLDLERAYIQLTHLRGNQDIRTADPGYYYTPCGPNFWNPINGKIGGFPSGCPTNAQ